MEKRFPKDDCGCGGSVLGRWFTVYSFSGPDSSSVTATKRVHMKVDNKVSTLEGCFWFSRPSLSAYFALKEFLSWKHQTHTSLLFYSPLWHRNQEHKSFGGKSVAASNCGDSMLSSPSPKVVAAQILRNTKNDNASAILCDMQAPIPIAPHLNTLSWKIRD